MKIVKETIKIFDREFIEIIILSSIFIAASMTYLLNMNMLEAMVLAPLFFLSVFFGIIASAHVLSFASNLIGMAWKGRQSLF